MKKTLHFAVSIASPREHVWNMMLGPETYRTWTAPFCAGSCFEGSWEAGSRMFPKALGELKALCEGRPVRSEA